MPAVFSCNDLCTAETISGGLVQCSVIHPGQETLAVPLILPIEDCPSQTEQQYMLCRDQSHTTAFQCQAAEQHEVLMLLSECCQLATSVMACEKPGPVSLDVKLGEAREAAPAHVCLIIRAVA